MRESTTWEAELTKALKYADDPGPVVARAGSPEDWTGAFDPGYGSSEGPPVLAWTETRVYFPVVYDGSEWLGSAPRNPQAEGQTHEGGE